MSNAPGRPTPSVLAAGVLWLVELGKKVIGIDAYTRDRPLRDMVADHKCTGDGRYIRPAHFAGSSRILHPAAA